MRLSTNIESVEDIKWASEGYCATHQGLRFIAELSVETLHGGAAFALEGPYGAGKSSLLAFALNRLTRPTGKHLFSNALCPSEKETSELKSLHERGGLTPLVFTGSTDSLAAKILSVARGYADDNPDAPGTEALRTALSISDGISPQTRVLRCLRTFAKAVYVSGRAGVLLAIDEFGRHLDQMLTPGGMADLHLLQEIAELTGRKDAPLTLVIVQHHGLDHYADKMLGDDRTEWEKVRGRFRETVLQNSDSDTARIIEYTLRLLPRRETEQVRRAIAPSRSKVAPTLMRDTAFLEACAPCRPLHPMTIALLARLSRLLGQQDRTVIGWLSSAQPTGFTAAQDAARSGWIRPDALFDHFFSDVLKTPSNPVFARRFAAIHGAWERIGDDLEASARTLFKVMAVLSFCSGDGISADQQNALACLPARFSFTANIERLVRRSLLVHREFRGEYVVWDGSDYDVIGKINAEISIIELDAADELNLRISRDVLAHRHYIETGNRRTARLIWLNSDQAVPTSEKRPRILIGLGAIPEAAACTSVDVRSSISLVEMLPHLKASVAIRRLLEGDTDLIGDKVALKEMRIRLAHHDHATITLAEEQLASSKIKWKIGDEEFASMQEATTAAMDQAYPKAFELHLDMFNRDRLSGQASAAFRKLIEAMFNSPSAEKLGIERFPAERILYEAFVRRSRLHELGRDGVWRLVTKGNSIPNGLCQTFAEIRRQFALEGTANSVEDVVCVLGEIPFGIKRNPALLLCAMVLLVERDLYELYESGDYLADWGPQTLVRMVKAPKRFSISATTNAPIDRSFMVNYRRALSGESMPLDDISSISVARAVLRRHAALSNFARSTQCVTDAAHALRRALRVAKSPGDMLFRAIPSALGYRRLPTSHSDIKEYLSIIEDARTSLESADQELLRTLGEVIMETLRKEPLSEARRECVHCAESVLQDSRIHHGYSAFISAALGHDDLDDFSWLAYVVDNGLSIRQPLDSWTDAQVSQAEFALRRTLLAIQEAGRMLEDAEVPGGAKPFLVFLPGETPKVRARQEQEAEAILASAPQTQRMAIITNLAQKFRETT